MLGDNDGIKRFFVKRQRNKEENLANFRQYYYMLEPVEREAFKRDVQKLVDTCEPFGLSPISVTMTCKINAYCQQSSESLSITGEAEPQEVLKAIDEWNRADEQ